LKEGTQSDPENKDALFRLLRFNVNYLNKSNAYISLEDYKSKMVDGQSKIYFAFGNSYDSAMKSPFYEPFKGKEVPVIILTNQLDEFCLTSSGEYKGMQF
jgi:molecular chaperone HtpG